MSDELADLRARVEALEDELAALKADVESEDTHPGGVQMFTDPRDASVVDALEPGQSVSLTRLRNLYLQRTDVRKENTLRDRVKRLTKTPLFEREKNGWTFVGEEDDE